MMISDFCPDVFYALKETVRNRVGSKWLKLSINLLILSTIFIISSMFILIDLTLLVQLSQGQRSEVIPVLSFSNSQIKLVVF